MAFSQPYYSPHPLIHLLRREAAPFIRAYYNTVAPMADRETYTFFEHFMGGPHKMHEEAQFLMQRRYMLYLEKGDTLKLLSGVPRAWLRTGKRIDMKNAASYFGPISLTVRSHADQGRITAVIDRHSDRPPNDWRYGSRIRKAARRCRYEADLTTLTLSES